MNDPIISIAKLIRHHIDVVCFGITAVSLMLAGSAINGFIQQVTQKFHWLVRYAVFVLVCTLGYGFLTHALYRGLMRWLLYQRSVELITITTIIYLGLAFFARKQGHI